MFQLPLIRTLIFFFLTIGLPQSTGTQWPLLSQYQQPRGLGLLGPLIDSRVIGRDLPFLSVAVKPTILPFLTFGLMTTPSVCLYSIEESSPGFACMKRLSLMNVTVNI